MVSRWLPLGLGVLTVGSLAPLLAWDVKPQAFSPRAHDVLAATPLALVAIAYLVHTAQRSGTWRALARASLVVVAFLCWAANQYWPDSPQATLLNDVAIAAFVIDLAAIVVGQPGAPVESG
jgi:hypothetical protein